MVQQSIVFLLLCVVGLSLIRSVRVVKQVGKLPTPAAVASNHADHATAKLCTLFGFNSRSGLYLYDAIFRDDAIPKDLIVFRAKRHNELMNVCKEGDVAIAHISIMEKNAGATSLLENLSTHVRGLCKTARSQSCLIVLFDGREGENTDLEKKIGDIVVETESFDCSLEVIFRYSGTDNAFDVEAVEAIRDTLLSRAIESSSRRKKPRSVAQLQSFLHDVRGSVIVNPLSKPLRSMSVEESRREFVATEACNDLPQDYSDRLNRSLTALMSSGLPAGSTVNTTMKALTASMARMTDEFLHDHRELLQTHAASQVALVQLPARCGAIATDLLYPIHRDIVQSMLQGSVEQFDKRAKKVAGNSPNLAELLAMLSETASKAFGNSLNHIHDVFASIVRSSEDAIAATVSSFSEQSGGKKLRQSSKAPPTLPHFDATFEKHRLRLHVQQRSTERIRELSLAGTHNPFVRNYPFPPLHLNVNYLLNTRAPPRFVLKDREVQKFYDVRPGVGEDRANPLVFDGVAMIPFNPNDGPPEPDSRGFFAKLRDFLSGIGKWHVETLV